MAKKFFYNKVHNTKRTIINAIIIGVCIIGVIICFIIVSNFSGEDQRTQNGNLSIKGEVTVEINEEYTNEIFFSKIENVDVDDIKVTYSLDFDISKPGKYDVTLTINEKNYTTTLNVVDTTMPELTIKNVEINKGKTYVAKDFVKECSDNSNQECKIEFYTAGVDEEGEKIDYSKYTEEGTYQVKIAAMDDSGNQTVKEATLSIGKNNEQTPTPEPEPEPVNCKYGDNTYDTNNYLLTVDITTNKCAVSLDLYKDEEMTKEINNLMNTETTKIKKDVEALNLTGTLALNRKITAVINTSGSGIVGYELKMTVTITHNKKTNTVAEYKVNANGKRVFTINPHKLAS